MSGTEQRAETSLGAGLLASGVLGSIIRKIQAAMGNISPEEGVR
jgi:hypothetical protein